MHKCALYCVIHPSRW